MAAPSSDFLWAAKQELADSAKETINASLGTARTLARGSGAPDELAKLNKRFVAKVDPALDRTQTSFAKIVAHSTAIRDRSEVIRDALASCVGDVAVILKNPDAL